MNDHDMNNILALRQLTAMKQRRVAGTGRNGSRHVGGVRIAAAKILSESLGFKVEPEEIHPQSGAWRTDDRLDVYRWELFTHSSPGMPFVAGCWERLTEFVSNSKKFGGCHYHDGEIYSGQADKPPAPPRPDAPRLVDYYTGEDIRAATDEEIDASGDTREGVILLASNGSILQADDAGADKARRVYVTG
jgi:hypothetical protein